MGCKLEVVPGSPEELTNSELKNSYTLHATLPGQVVPPPPDSDAPSPSLYLLCLVNLIPLFPPLKFLRLPYPAPSPPTHLPLQVAWCEAGGTKFSKYFSQALCRRPPIPLATLDEFINWQLDQEDGADTCGHKQAVQMDKWVVIPFHW